MILEAPPPSAAVRHWKLQPQLAAAASFFATAEPLGLGPSEGSPLTLSSLAAVPFAEGAAAASACAFAGRQSAAASSRHDRCESLPWCGAHSKAAAKKVVFHGFFSI